jgi:nicotinamidase-related amidase
MAANALIVVDMLNDFIRKEGALYCGETAEAIIPFVRSRLDVFREQAALIVFLQDSHDAADREFEKFPKHCVAGSWGSEIISELTPRPGETVIPKKRYSGFYGTPLEAVLAAGGAQSVEVVGVCTSICVMDTVGGLADRDYEVVVPTKGVADFDPQNHAFALKRMQTLYGAQVI